MDEVKYSSDIGQDTVFFIDKQRSIAYYSVHLSNTPQSFQQQLVALQASIHLLTNYLVVVTGDFNAHAVLADQSLLFYAKDVEENERKSDNAQGKLAFPNRKIVLGSNSVPTSAKVRVITNQVHKMLDKISVCIDWCFVVLPEESKEEFFVQSRPMVFDRYVRNGEVAPANWCSDHFMLYSFIQSAKGARIRVSSLNVLGESIESEAFNIFEFMSQAALDEFKLNPEIEKRFREIISTHPGIGNESFADLVKRKAFSKNLRNLELMNVHCPPFPSNNEFSIRLKEKYEQELLNLKNESEEVQKYATSISSLFQKFYTDKVLSPFFERWFSEACTIHRQKFSEVLLTYLSSSSSLNIDVFALQEVSQTMRLELLSLSSRLRSMGYELVFAPGSPSTKTKTVGALLVRSSSSSTNYCTRYYCSLQ
jgi:hypothetical protein